MCSAFYIFRIKDALFSKGNENYLIEINEVSLNISNNVIFLNKKLSKLEYLMFMQNSEEIYNEIE